MELKNTVELLGYYGSDETIACSAWTSTSRELTQDKKDRIPNLISKLWQDGHKTPFEKGTVHFLINCDIASHIHLLKHRTFSINAESARYKELKEDKYYIPDVLKEKYCGLGLSWGDVLQEYTKKGNLLYHECLNELTKYKGRKRAKEVARYFKTYNSQIQSDILLNMSSFANFLTLRNSLDSQLEIREIAAEMLRLVENIEGNPFEYTIKAFKNK